MYYLVLKHCFEWMSNFISYKASRKRDADSAKELHPDKLPVGWII